MTNAKINVLYVSLRNTARSVLAQACLEQLGGRRFNAYYCVSPYHVGDVPHPAAQQALMNAGVLMGQFECTDWSTFMRNGAIRMHFVITLAEKLSELARLGLVNQIPPPGSTRMSYAPLNLERT
nr:hypothetical protein [uncultured Albidiferax sp.]